MYCTHCGNQVDDEDIFCAVCGTKVKRAGAKREPSKDDTSKEISADNAIKSDKPKQKKAKSESAEQVIEEVQQESSVPVIPPELLQSLAEPEKKEKRKLTTGEIIGIVALCCSVIILLLYLGLSIVNRKLTQFVNNVNSQVNTAGTSDIGNAGSNVKSDAEVIPAGVTNEEAHAGYKVFIQSKAFDKDDEAGHSVYYLFDMDLDGIEELIIKSGTCEVDSQICIATFKEGKLVYFEGIDGMHAAVYGEADGGLTVSYSAWSGDDQAVTKYILDGRSLHKQIISEPHEIKSEADVIKVDGTLLESYRLKDLSALD